MKSISLIDNSGRQFSCWLLSDFTKV